MPVFITDDSILENDEIFAISISPISNQVQIISDTETIRIFDGSGKNNKYFLPVELQA